MLKRVKAFYRDERGSYELIQFVLVLPVVILVLYGSFELMKLASIRQSLEAGAYQAARYLSVYHKYYVDPHYNRNVDDRMQAERLIRESLLANSYLSRETSMTLIVRYYNGGGQEIASPVEFRCDDAARFEAGLYNPNTTGLVFTLRAWVTFPWKASMLGMPLGNVTLGAAHTAFVDCGPWTQPPPPTPTPEP